MKRATVAIIGRPNVGKSTLFNRIVGGRAAIVDDRAGVTRDRHFARAEWTGKRFFLVDTGGWTRERHDGLGTEIRRQITLAIDESDAILFVVDNLAGPHPADREVADLLRKHRERVVLVANKVDDLPQDTSHYAFHELGLGDPEPVSAATGKGTGDLLDRLAALLPESGEDGAQDEIQVAVVGRPNVGKSSIVNCLLGEERSIVTPQPGTTRDAVDSPLRYHGRTLNFIDTAGLRKRSKVEDEIEFYSTLRTERAIEQADVCVLVVDATVGIHIQDLRIAQDAWEKGAGLVLAVNKWDLVPDKDSTTPTRGQQAAVDRAPFLRWIPFVYVSALTGQRTRKILDLILEVAAARDRRIPTSEVNTVLASLVARNQPPQKPGGEVKLLYASQFGTRPPRFGVVASRPKVIPESYRRYLEKGFREAWGFMGAPIQLAFRRKRGRR